MKLTSGDFCELNKAFRQTCRSTFGIGKVLDRDEEYSQVGWIRHTGRDLRDPACQTERVPNRFLRRLKTRDDILLAAHHLLTKGRRPRFKPFTAEERLLLSIVRTAGLVLRENCGLARPRPLELHRMTSLIREALANGEIKPEELLLP
ncbi:MAG: hypothetical protein HS110_07300 [Zoogloeaceae bacterium]|nr:hypothetical protein [Zoogloeaceae bacterium]